MKLLKGWKELAFIVFLAALSALMVRHFLLAPYHVPSASMQPALQPGDFIFVSQVAYGVPTTGPSRIGILEPRRGDIVTFYETPANNTAYVKRVVGISGDRIEIKNNRLVINGIPLSYTLLESAESGVSKENPNPQLFDLYEEKWEDLSWKVIFLKRQGGKAAKDFAPLKVPPGQVFLLGDNREVSDDSRDWGTVPTAQIFGRVSLIWLSLNRQQPWAGGRLPSMRWERILTRVH